MPLDRLLVFTPFVGVAGVQRIAHPFQHLVVELSAKFNLPEPKLIDLSHERDPAAAARTLRQVWALGEQPISNMVRLLELKGVRVFSLAENTKNVDAFSCWRND